MSEDLSFGYWVRRRRKALDMTQAELGQCAGASAAMIRKIEADERRPSRELAEALANALSLSPSERESFLRAARDIRAIEELVVSAELPPSLPPAHLPAPVTSLVNRVTALAEVGALVTQDKVRLLTLIGPPGIGKTRLSIQVARQVLPFFRDGVWFVDLSAINDPDRLLPSIALALNLPPAPGLTPAQRVHMGLHDQSTLLVLDNLEQVIAGAALIVADLLRACPNIKVLATSRLRLDIYGEHEYPLPPMTLPPPADAYDPAELMRYEAIQLFTDRARQHDPHFALTAETAVPVAQICCQMDGLPLALELAATRTRQTPVADLAAALREASGRDWHALLHTSARDLPPRQQTLFNTVAWSYSLLTPAQQLFLRRLGVFEGDFDAAAVAAICDDVETTVLPMLALLVGHSLVNLEARRPQRWRLLEMIREFVLSQLSAIELQAARAAHAHHFATAGSAVRANWSDYGFLEAVDPDLDNYRAALRYALAVKDPHLTLELGLVLGYYCERRGLIHEGRDLLRHVLALTGEIDPQQILPVLFWAANLAWMNRDFAEAESYSAVALSLTHSHALPAMTTATLNMLGRIYLEQGRYEEADRVLLEAIELSCTMSPPQKASMEIIQRGEVALAQGRLEDAATLTHEGLAGLNDVALIPFCMGWTNLAEVALARGSAESARAALEQVLPLVHLHARRARLWLTAVAGYFLMAERNPAEPEVLTTVRLLAAIKTANEREGDLLSPMTQAQTAVRDTAARARLAPAAWQTAWDEGLRWTLQEAIHVASELLQESR